MQATPTLSPRKRTRRVGGGGGGGGAGWRVKGLGVVATTPSSAYVSYCESLRGSLIPSASLEQVRDSCLLCRRRSLVMYANFGKTMTKVTYHHANS